MNSESQIIEGFMYKYYEQLLVSLLCKVIKDYMANSYNPVICGLYAL